MVSIVYKHICTYMQHDARYIYNFTELSKVIN